MNASSIRCSEEGSSEHERWSSPWRPSQDDLAKLLELATDRVLKLELRGDGMVRVGGRDLCGRVRLPSGTILEIRTKIPVRTMLEWLAFTRALPELDEWSDGPALRAGGDVVSALVALYVHALTHLTRFHWRPGYAAARDQRADVRGRIDARRLASVAGHLPAFPCTYRERTMDTLPNRVLARALDAACNLVGSARDDDTARRLEWLAREWRDIDRDLTDLTSAIASAIAQPPLGYRTSLQIARLLLGGGATDSVDGDGGHLFVVKMNVVWEHAVRRLVAAWANEAGHRVATDGERTLHWENSDDDATARWLTPDALVFAKRAIVFDAKYKRAYGAESREDRFQIAAYAMAFGAVAATLVYPTATTEPRLRRLLRTAVPGAQPSDLYSIELPMAHGPAACASALSVAMAALAPAAPV